MNKLREKLYDWHDSETNETVEENIIELEQITDDFSCQFGDWIISSLGSEHLRKFTTTEPQQYFKENIYGK